MEHGREEKMRIAEQRLIKSSTVVEETGCWLFSTHIKTPVSVHRRMMVLRELDGAHRWSYRVWVGEIPVGMQVNHHCDVPACFRPDHLYAGTQSQNILDAVRRSRHPKNMGGSVLSSKQVEKIREADRHLGQQKELAVKYRVSRHTIQRIWSGKTWVA